MEGGNSKNIPIDLAAGFVNPGNQSRIKSVMRRAEAGEAITIAFLGGSITQGSLASEQSLCYASRVYKWWTERFPKASITFINAGIGATDSQFGAARVDEDVLSYEPDMVQIEYAVNDECSEHYLETYEGVVRRVYDSPKKPGVMLMYNVFYNSGTSAELMHAKVARHYDLPAVSMRSTIFPLLLAGKLDNREVTPDDLHPNDLGHELVAAVITYALGVMADELDKADVPEQEYPAPLSKNRYEGSVRYRNSNSDAVLTSCSGWTKDEAPQEHITDIFKKGWTATDKGAELKFRLKAKTIALQYRRTIELPGPVAAVYVDGSPVGKLDANFDETWGDKLCLSTVYEADEPAEHEVSVVLDEVHEGDVLPFYLVSIIGA